MSGECQVCGVLGHAERSCPNWFSQWEQQQAEIERLENVADAAKEYIELFNDNSRPGVFEAFCNLNRALKEKEVGSE